MSECDREASKRVEALAQKGLLFHGQKLIPLINLLKPKTYVMYHHP